MAKIYGDAVTTKLPYIKDVVSLGWLTKRLLMKGI